MSSLSTFYIKKEMLKTLYETIEKKGEKGLGLTISIDDSTNQYGQNISAWVEQTKEQREAKHPRFFVGNGRVVWSNGTITVAERKEQPASEPAEEGDGLPF